MAEKILIAELDFNVDGLIKAATEAQLALDELKKAQMELGVRTDANTQQFIENEVAQKKVRATLNEHKKSLVALSDAGGRQVDTTNKMHAALTRENTSIEVAQKSNAELTRIRNRLNLATDEGRKSAALINKRIEENTKFVRDNSDAVTKQKMDIGGYKNALTAAFPQLNSLIDGLQQAKEGLDMMGGATKASTVAVGFKIKALILLKKALIGTGIFAIVVALGSLIAFLATTQKGIDAVTSVTRPAIAVFQSLLGVVQNLGGALFDIFSPGGLGRFLGTVKDLGKDTGAAFSEGIEKGKEIDRLTKEIERSNLRYKHAQIAVNDELDKQLLIARDTSRSFEEREAASLRIIEVTKQNGIEEAKIIELEIQRLKMRQSLNDMGLKGQEEMIDLQVRLDAARDRGIQAEREEIRVISGARKEAQKERAAAEKEQRDKETAANKEQIERELEAEKEASEERIRIAQIEAEKAIELANRELELYKRNNQSRLDGNKFVTDELLAQETARLEALRLKESEHQKILLENGKISQFTYNAAIEDINHQNRMAIAEAEAAREQARKEKEMIDFELSQELRVLRNENMFQIMQDDELRRHQLAVSMVDKTGADINLLNQKHAEIRKNIDRQAEQAKMEMASNSFGQMAEIFGKESTVGKAMSVAQAKINTFLGITKALTLPFPANLVAIAAATATGFGAVRNILNTRMPAIPKAEKGALFEVGGKRHSMGGTKFYGEDGTTFEAEKNELIGVMSRVASEKFMQFNNKFTPGRSMGNYFATGGIVSRGRVVNEPDQRPIVMPTVQVDVKDIIREVQNRVTLVDLANI